MKTKAQNPINFITDKNFFPLIQAYFEINHLKQLYRQGWLLRGIPPDQCESVAEHSFGVAILTLILADTYFPELDSGKLLKMALAHDLGEVYAGDIVPRAGIPPKDKHQLEKKSVSQIFEKLPNGSEYFKLWEEFEAGESPESQLIRQIDKLEMALQASVYQHLGFEYLSEFFDSARERITSPELIEILDNLKTKQSKE
jgi:putative hydrolase of HD superfamily